MAFLIFFRCRFGWKLISSRCAQSLICLFISFRYKDEQRRVLITRNNLERSESLFMNKQRQIEDFSLGIVHPKHLLMPTSICRCINQLKNICSQCSESKLSNPGETRYTVFQHGVNWRAMDKDKGALF